MNVLECSTWRLFRSPMDGMQFVKRLATLRGVGAVRKRPEQLNPEQILSEWDRMGVATLQDVATRVSEITAGAQPLPERLPDLDDLLHETPPEVARTLTHRPMKYRAIVDGSEVSNLERFAGQPLYFVVEKDVLAGGRVRTFSMLSAFKQHIRQTLAQADADGIVSISPWDHLTADCIFYDDVGGGNVKSLQPGQWYHDLTKVTRNYWWKNWNDVISEIDFSRSYRVAWEHIDGNGDALALLHGQGVPNLADIGWNDRISSIANLG
jgi:hypothetical protein